MPTNYSFLDRAFKIAEQVDPHATRPNPRVGCVIVRDDQIVAEGVHERRGQAHAEVNALAKARGCLSDSDVYITLEPCDAFKGKQTGSCTKKLLKQKPRKIIIGAQDIRFGGKNIEQLRAAGINVELAPPSYAIWNDKLNPFYEKFTRTRLPYVTLKLAQSLDGQIVHPDGRWVSNAVSREYVHEMRAHYAALLTTSKTVARDNPMLNVRLKHFARPFSDPDVLVLGNPAHMSQSAMLFRIPHREVHLFSMRPYREIMMEAAMRGIDSIMTECGQHVSTDLLAEGWVDEIQLFIAPHFFGQIKNAFTSTHILSDFVLTDMANMGGDIWVQYRRKTFAEG